MPFSKTGTSFIFFYLQSTWPPSLTFPALFEPLPSVPRHEVQPACWFEHLEVIQVLLQLVLSQSRLKPYSFVIHMYYVNHLIRSDLFQPSLMQKTPEPLWAFSASVNGFLFLMSNPLAFDFLLPLMYLLNDFLLLAMLLLVKSYLLCWLFCVCPRLLLLVVVLLCSLHGNLIYLLCASFCELMIRPDQLLPSFPRLPRWRDCLGKVF